MVKIWGFLAGLCLFCVATFGSGAASSGAALSQNSARAQEILSSQKQLTDTRGWLDVAKMAEILRQNKLYDSVSFASPNLNLKFTATQGALAVLIKGVNLSLKATGAQLSRVNELSNLAPQIYSVVATKSGGIDPVGLANALKASGIGVIAMSRDSGALVFELDMQGANLQGEVVRIGQESALTRSTSEYFINLSGAKSVQIVSNEPNTWTPLVRVYDKNLVQIAKFEENSLKKDFKINLPSGAKYALIGDKTDMNNIKNELVVKLVK